MQENYMNLLDLIKTSKVDFTNFKLEWESSMIINYSFEINPNEFLNFSKQDLKEKTVRGFINSLSNAKRAIDCQVDKVFQAFNLDPNKFPKSVELFIATQNFTSDIPSKLKFIQALNLAPVGIISRIRALRNKLEHSYQKPTEFEVQEAVEIAELFIRSIDSKLNRFYTDYYVTDANLMEMYSGKLTDSLYFRYDENENQFELSVHTEDGRISSVITRNDLTFLYLLKLSTSMDYEQDFEDSLKELLSSINHPLPSKHIKFET